ncbi:MOSC domain-containing protein [Niallia sp. 03133]|uniref:MOSC domain-containing protein n=1 Tax=Niallia sp. 03133 TaxID=3458060 RepID=UPI004044362C
MKIGEIKKLVRHPVKSFAGESVSSSQILNYGLYGDRSHGFIDKSKNKYLTITQYPNMVTYRARFLGEDNLQEYPPVEVMNDKGEIFQWGDLQLLHELEEHTKRELETKQHTPDNVPVPAIEVDHILLITENSLQSLEEIWGEPIDERRFRGNIVFAIPDNAPITEEMLIGQTIKIGNEVVLHVNDFCERCMIVTVDPNTGEKQPSLLKKIVKERNNHFGLYASVVKTGKIHVGDSIVLENNRQRF